VGRVRPDGLLVQCCVRDGDLTLVERWLVRVPADAPASGVLDGVLRLALEERRRGLTLTIDAPAELVALLALAGLGDVPGALRP
jgi:hypothetical protein